MTIDKLMAGAPPGSRVLIRDGTAGYWFRPYYKAGALWYGPTSVGTIGGWNGSSDDWTASTLEPLNLLVVVLTCPLLILAFIGTLTILNWGLSL